MFVSVTHTWGMLHRGPGAAVHEVVRQGKRGLARVMTAGAYDIDVLCAAGCARAVAAGFEYRLAHFALATVKLTHTDRTYLSGIGNFTLNEALVNFRLAW